MPWQPVFRLGAATFVAYCSYAMCRAPLLPLFARDLGAGPALVGLVMAASTLTGVVLKLPAGALSDIVGRRRLLIAGAIVFASLPFTYVLVSTLALLVLLRAVHGSATAIFGPVAAASLADVAPPERRGAWLSIYSTAQGAGQALGPVLAGSLIAAGSYHRAFAVSGAIGLAVPLIVAGFRPGSAGALRRPRWNEFARGVKEVCANRLVLATSAAQAAQFVLNGTLAAFLPLYGRDVLGLSVAQLGWLFGMQTLTTLTIRPAIGTLSDRIGRRWVIATGLTIGGASVFALSRAATAPAAAAAVAVYAAGTAATTGAASAFITDVTPRARYGAAHGVFGTIYDVGDALGPIVAGMLVVTLGYAPMFQVMAAIALMSAITFAITTSGRGINS
jgi:MFS family permease